MSNFALGMAVGSSMQATMQSTCEDITIDAWVAWVFIVTLVICIGVTIYQGLRRKVSLIDTPMEAWLFGPVIGTAIWAVFATIFSVFGWLISSILQ